MSEWSPNPIASTEAEIAAAPALDLDAIEGDLVDVELALERLDSGQYWNDEVTGATIADATLDADPTARRATDR